MVKCSKDTDFEEREPERPEGINDSENDTSDFMRGMEDAEEKKGASHDEDEDISEDFEDDGSYDKDGL